MKVDKARGMNVSVVTTAKTDEEARKLLQLLGMPFRRIRRIEEQNGHDRKDCQGTEVAQVQDPSAEPLQAVRTAARIHAQVQAVPALFPAFCARRRRHRSDEELLVSSRGSGGFRVPGSDAGSREVERDMTDPISDMLTRLRNAVTGKHTRVDVPASKLKIEIARILQDEGYIQGFSLVEEPSQKSGRQPRQVIRVFLKYGPRGERVISGIERISRPGVVSIWACRMCLRCSAGWAPTF